MGFSVSGTAAIFLVAFFIASGTFVTAVSNGFEDVTAAQAAETDEVLRKQNIEITIVDVSYDADTDILTVAVNNTGTVALSVDDTDFVVDNTYQSSFASRRVSGDETTDLWLPGEALVVEISTTTTPVRVQVVTEHGIAETEVV